LACKVCAATLWNFLKAILVAGFPDQFWQLVFLFRFGMFYCLPFQAAIAQKDNR